MNEQNLNYLKENIKYLGFGEKLHAELEQKLAEGSRNSNYFSRTTDSTKSRLKQY